MATVINGTNMTLSVAYDDSPTAGELAVFAAATSCTCTITIDAPEVTVKASKDRKEFIGLSSSWTVDAECFYTEDGGSVPDMKNLYPTAIGDANASQNGMVQYPREVLVKFSGGSDEYQGTGYITSLTASGGTEDAGTFSVSIQGSGFLDDTP